MVGIRQLALAEDGMMAHEEYLRRNLLLAGAYGANAGLDTAIKRLRSTKRPPSWLLKSLAEVKARIEPLPYALDAYRNLAKDRPRRP